MAKLPRDRVDVIEERLAALEQRLAEPPRGPWRYLEKKIEELECRVTESSKDDVEFMKAVVDNKSNHEAHMTDIFQRLMNIELKLFPHLARGLDNLQNVIGEHDTPTPLHLDVMRDKKLPKKD